MIWIACDKNCEPGPNQYVCRGEERAHEFVMQDGSTGNEIIEARCGNCDSLNVFLLEDWQDASLAMDRRAQRSVGKAGLTRWPYFDAATGVEVKSKEHRAEVWKAHGMHEAEHGVNEKYDDEACHQQKEKRVAREQKKMELNRRRKALGIAPKVRKIR